MQMSLLICYNVSAASVSTKFDTVPKMGPNFASIWHNALMLQPVLSFSALSKPMPLLRQK